MFCAFALISRTKPVAQVAAALLPILFLVVLQTSPVKIVRYELPVLLLIGFRRSVRTSQFGKISKSEPCLLLQLRSLAGYMEYGNVYQSWGITHDT